jgi:ribosome biogenesis GTPase / thiamine phosphate phosphatase
MIAELSGKFLFAAEDTGDYPVVGDWVLIRAFPEEEKGIIEHILPRQSKFSRKSAGIRTDEQVLASNIDFIFIMSSMNEELNPRRIERYLTLAFDFNIQPVVVLSKSDLTTDSDEILESVKSISSDIQVHLISSVNNSGIDELRKYFSGNKTAAIIGSSGVGKTTLINKLIGTDELKVNEISLYKDKGVHTTTRREMFLLKYSGLIIDTPGLRELQLWDGSDGLDTLFADIKKLSDECKFNDCKHESEPGCAVQIAIDDGLLDYSRYKSYLKLKREANYFVRKVNIKEKLKEKKKWKKITAVAKEKSKYKYQ